MSTPWYGVTPPGHWDISGCGQATARPRRLCERLCYASRILMSSGKSPPRTHWCHERRIRRSDLPTKADACVDRPGSNEHARSCSLHTAGTARRFHSCSRSLHTPYSDMCRGTAPVRPFHRCSDLQPSSLLSHSDLVDSPLSRPTRLTMVATPSPVPPTA